MFLPCLWLQLDNKPVLEGQLRVHWGIRNPICFRQKDESPSAMKIRHSWAVPVVEEHKVSDDSELVYLVWQPEAGLIQWI